VQRSDDINPLERRRCLACTAPIGKVAVAPSWPPSSSRKSKRAVRDVLEADELPIGWSRNRASHAGRVATIVDVALGWRDAVRGAVARAVSPAHGERDR
jgi:hypothetical protein